MACAWGSAGENGEAEWLLEPTKSSGGAVNGLNLGLLQPAVQERFNLT
jgi:hypothetical protein